MNLVKTSILSFIATAVKLLSALVINKAVAIFIGPSGLALIGQFQNFTQLVMTVAQGGINQGVTKYVAEYGAENLATFRLFSTATRISATSSLLVSFFIIVFSSWISNKFLNTDEYAYIFILFGITLSLFVVNQLLLSILNGLKDVRTFILINIIQSIYSLVFTTLMIVWLGIDGAFIAMVTNQSIILFIILWILRNHAVIKFKRFFNGIDNLEAKKLLKYSAMALTSAAAVPVSQMLVRDYLGENLGWDMAGYWQAIWYISSMYLMVVTTALSIYYLPRLSEITDKSTLRNELISGYKVIMPLLIITALIIYVLKDFVIWLLFTENFSPMRELFKWQLIGDVIKMASWLLAYLMLAKAMAKMFIVTEVAFSVLFVLLTMLFVNFYGLVGVTYAFTLNYSIYLILMAFLMKKEVF